MSVFLMGVPFVSRFRIITNNPLVQEKYPEATEFIGAGVEGVLIAVRDRVHMGVKLINHPLSGGVMPGVSPYKSLVVTDEKVSGACRTDFESLRLIESALAALEVPSEGLVCYDDDTLEDFRVLDFDLLPHPTLLDG